MHLEEAACGWICRYEDKTFLNFFEKILKKLSLDKARVHRIYNTKTLDIDIERMIRWHILYAIKKEPKNEKNLEKRLTKSIL